MENELTPPIEKRRMIAKILKAGLTVAMHERKGPANYVKIHPSVDIGEELAGMRIEKDESLSGIFVIGRDCDKFEITQEL